MSSTPAQLACVKSLYRSLLREANRLPYGYLRAFFRFKYRDDADSTARAIAHNKTSSTTKLRRLEREVRKISSANNGDKSAFGRLLNLAYGRTGKLRWELLEPFLHSRTTETPPPIILGVERSRPPVHTKELLALLSSSFSRTTGRGLKPNEIVAPPSIASRLDPSSKASQLLGPVSKRREVNARWRHFRHESSRVYVPLQVSVEHMDKESDTIIPLTRSDQAQEMRDFGLIGGGFQDSGLLESLQSMVGGTHQYSRPRRGKEVIKNEHEGSARPTSTDISSAPLPTRLLRRTHRRPLGILPILTFFRNMSKQESQPQSKGSYEVSLAKSSIPTSHKVPHLPLIDDRNMTWVRHAQEIEARRKSRK